MSRRAVWTAAFAVLMLASALAAAAAITVAGRRIASARAAAPLDTAMALLTPPAEPIAAEARVFLTRASVLAIDPSNPAHRSAHPRSLATYNALRAYAGAPPRIPHGLPPTEFQTGGCKTCHEKGGFSLRFGAYVPLTPHPEMGACLQCHVGDAKLMAIALPRMEPSDRCRQCHAPGATRWRDSTLNWTGLAEPPLMRSVRGRTPPPIPHPLQMRENCLACHASPQGVAGIPTPHPEWANCRQCHVEGAGMVTPYERKARGGVRGGDGS